MYQFSIVHLRVTYSVSKVRLEAWIQDAEEELCAALMNTRDPNAGESEALEVLAYHQVLMYGQAC